MVGFAEGEGVGGNVCFVAQMVASAISHSGLIWSMDAMVSKTLAKSQWLPDDRNK